jgi:large subunit ribosomal protein L24
MSNWIKKDDTVYIIAGNDKGKTGKVLRVNDDKILVEGINIRKKHIKKSQKSQVSQIVNVEIPIHISNVALCDKEGKKIRKLKVKRNNKKSRDLVYLDGDKETVYRSIKKKAKAK